MDIMLVILLLGIVISYLSAVISFLSDTPLTMGSLGDALVVATCMALLSLVPDLGYLSKASAIGLVVLAGTFAVITAYGVWGEHTTTTTHDSDEQYTGDSATNSGLTLWPSSIASLSRFFGIVVFGYGVVPLTFNFQESMREPHRMVEATFIALSLVGVGYCVLGVGLLILFGKVQGEILHELPHSGLIPTVTRLAMASVCIMTAPLIIVPTGELVEAKFQITQRHHQAMVRGSVCGFSALVAVLLPTFVQVLSFVGCFCVGLTGFCVPPLFHLRLLYLQSRTGAASMTQTLSSSFRSMALSPYFWLDVVMLIWGLFATVVGTFFTLG